MKKSAFTSIERESDLPVYRQIYTILRRELNRGSFDHAETLPSEKELCGRFGVERNTVRKALQLLVDEGLVQKVPGYGTKIVRETPDEKKKQLSVAAQLRRNILMLAREADPLGGQVEYFHVKLMHLLERNISDMGYNLVYKTLGPSSRLKEILSYTCPAALLLDSYLPPHYYEQAKKLGVPCVSINHYTPLFTSVVSNNYDGAYEIAKLMYGAGHRNIALVTGKSGYQTTMERLSGFQSFTMEKELRLNSKYQFSGDWLFDSGFEIGERILSIPQEERPTAIFAFNDDLAYGCLSCLEKHGVDVPNEMSLAGFDRSDRYDGVFRPITTVDVNIGDMVRYACWFLKGLLQEDLPGSLAKIQVETTIIDHKTIAKFSPKYLGNRI